jgi:imidazolonepropionase-like amidohydrolase
MVTIQGSSFMNRIVYLVSSLILLGATQSVAQTAPSNPPTKEYGYYAILAGKLIDPENGTTSPGQTIIVRQGRITEIGFKFPLPTNAEIVDLSGFSVMPGLVDAHTHLAMTMRRGAANSLFLTYLDQPTALRAIQAVSNGIQMLSSGFTVVRDMGNSGLYADSALRMAIEQGWVPGPTIINAGIIIGGRGGQFTPTPEMGIQHHIVYPEYLEADTPDEIVKAVRENILYGAKLIKVCVDCKPYVYSLEDLKIFVREASNAGAKVAGHVQTEEGARRAIEAGFWSLEHDIALTPEIHKLMAKRGVWRVGTEEPFTSYTGSQPAFARTVEGIKNAYATGVNMAFSTDIASDVPGLTRGERAIDFLTSWKASGIPNKEILKIITTNGYKVTGIEAERGPLKVGFPADIIAVRGSPLEDIDALRSVVFVMKDGQVFKRAGATDVEQFFHSPRPHGASVH